MHTDTRNRLVIAITVLVAALLILGVRGATAGGEPTLPTEPADRPAGFDSFDDTPPDYESLIPPEGFELGPEAAEIEES